MASVEEVAQKLVELRIVGGFDDDGGGGQEARWAAFTLPLAMLLVSRYLPHSTICLLLWVNTHCRHVLSTYAPLWKELDLHGMTKAGERLLAALSLSRYKNLEVINLEFAQDVEDEHLASVTCKDLQVLNLNACQRITDAGVKAVTSTCNYLKSFSIYWNLKVTDIGVESLVKNCRLLTHLNLSGCKNISDRSLHSIAKYCPNIKSLNLTRCVKLTDDGLAKLLKACLHLEELYLYAIPGFTEEAFKLFSGLHELKLLDICGAQNLTDNCLVALAECKSLVSLNLTWCVNVTDEGIIPLFQNCQSLEVLSLYGIRGVTDKGLECLSQSCKFSLRTLDVSGCVNIKRKSQGELLQLFPALTCFQVHS
ncbi:hypothetical protein O6H91_06G054800 [Diphasiastrum complanatum]|uniref:Uncharacterized protein n=1 Tax=Diphasiastrum complanatum TaxID=34168 RepID=A0ACC2DDN6_DIPCM|nr:hypothetical protein O6H91_06G054800 [Diphasiastrum complanatum]